MKEQPVRPPRKDPETAGRRQYRKPKLTEYGSIAKLTQGTRTRNSDGPGGGFRNPCL
jgi:hypothetical protein